MPRFRIKSKHLETEEDVTSDVCSSSEGAEANLSLSLRLDCDICLGFHPTANCSVLTYGPRIPDAEVLPKALASLPPTFEARKVDNGSYTIIAKEVMRKGTQFGPLEAPARLSPIRDSVPGDIYAVGDAAGEHRYLDLNCLSDCNWMSLVKFSTDGKRSNCISYQIRGRIHFVVTTDVNVGSELVVTYSPGYRKFMSTLSLLHSEEPAEKAEFTLRSSQRILQKRRKSEEDPDKSPRKRTLGSRPMSTINSAGRKNKLGDTSEVVKRKRGKRKVISEGETDEDKFLTRYQESGLERRERLRRLGPCLALDEWNCKFCSIVFGNLSDFASHLILHYKLVGAAKTEKGRLAHVTNGQAQNEAHSIDDSFDLPSFPYTCDICEREKTFNRAEYIIRHLSKHALWSDCQSCGQTIRGDLHNCSNNSSTGSFECKLCSMRLSTASGLSSHLLHKHKGGRTERERERLISTSFPCSTCNKRFGSEETLHSHSCPPNNQENIPRVPAKIDQDDPRSGHVFTCNFCDETVDEETHLCLPATRPSLCLLCNKKLSHTEIKMHRRICQSVHDYSSGKKSTLQCPLCPWAMTEVEEFRTHVGHHTHPVMCPACQLRVSSSAQLKQHECADFPCDGCVEIFESFLDLRHHIKSIHGNADFYCYECALPFLTEDGYKTHKRCEVSEENGILSLPPSGDVGDSDYKPKTTRSKKLGKKKRNWSQEGDFVCEVCGAHYTKLTSLKTHRLTHDPKRYECTTCGKQFHRRELLTDHLYVHQPAQFPCSFCGKLFKTPKAQGVHSRIHTGLKKHSCEYEGCGKSFVQRINLISHSATHLPLEEKFYQCPYCPKHLASKETATVHIRSHEEKPFRCEFCPREFLRPAMLRRHIALSHGTHRYACQFCPIVIKIKSTFLRHLGKRHPEFMDVWGETGYVDSRLTPFEASTAPTPRSSRRNQVVILLGQDTVTEEGLGDKNAELEESQTTEEVVEETILGMEPENEVEVEYHRNEDNLILSNPENHGSEFKELLLQVNQNGELILSLGGEEVEVIQGEDFLGDPEIPMELMEEK